MKTLPILAALATLALPALATSAAAQEAGTMTLGLGLHGVMPKSDNGSLAGGTLETSVGDSIRPTVTFEYFLRRNLGLEVLAALPFKHTIDIDGLGRVGSTHHLPPVISLQYHFTPEAQISPFVGVGVNYTNFFDTQTDGALAASDLDLGDSWGLALHAGLDYRLGPQNALRVDLRWMDIDTDVRLDGAKIGSVEVDPLVAGVAWVHRF